MGDSELVEPLKYGLATGATVFVTWFVLDALVFEKPAWAAALQAAVMGVAMGAVFFYGRWRGFGQ